MKTKKKKADKKPSKLELDPIFPKIVIQRVTKTETFGKSKILVARKDQEETRYGVVFEVGDNNDFKRGEVIILHQHSGHDFTWTKGTKSLNLTVISPEDVVCKIQGTPKELADFLDRARDEL